MDNFNICNIYRNIINENLGKKHLNPDGKRKARKEAAFLKLKSESLNNARNNIIKIKKELKKIGYVIKLSDYSYTIRNKKIIGLSKPNTGIDIKIKKYHKILVTLAHEFGHVLQWDNSSNEKHMFNFWFDKLSEAEKYNDPMLFEQIKMARTMYYELDAWDKAKQFIPREIYNYFFKDMKESLDTYKNSMFYMNFNRFPIVKELAQKLNYKI